ncbi:DUF6461 domain-containing protein [Actinophytocola sp.]|uniref:DUF6461 domain-containing protein n=1 Tax=Actinophytocola sp. TaxID=1872138 RepID=UPI003D6BBDDA
MRQLIDKYAWIQEYDTLAWTVAVIQGRTEPDVIAVYGGDPAESLESRPFDDAIVPDEDFGTWFYLQTVTADTAVVAIENNGWTGTVPEIARRATAAGGRFCSVHWNVEGRWRIVQANDGQVTACFDVSMAADGMDTFDKLPAWLDDADLSDDSLDATCLAILEQQTGLAFEPSWLTVPLPTYRIPDPDVLLKDVENARLP